MSGPRCLATILPFPPNSTPCAFDTYVVPSERVCVDDYPRKMRKAKHFGSYTVAFISG